MPRNSRLGGDGDIILKPSTASDAGLGDDEAMFTDDHVVADLGC